MKSFPRILQEAGTRRGREGRGELTGEGKACCRSGVSAVTGSSEQTLRILLHSVPFQQALEHCISPLLLNVEYKIQRLVQFYATLCTHALNQLKAIINMYYYG